MASRIGRDLRSVPNLISLARIACILLAAPIYFQGWTGIAIALGAIAGLTDYVDGWVARATGQVTRLGEILDQFGDLCFESLLLLVAVSNEFFPPVVLFAYLFREFWVSCLRRFMAEARMNIPSSLWGKVKTNLLMWGLLPSFLSIGKLWPSAEPYLGQFGKLAVGLGLVASYVSAFGYTRAFIRGYDRPAERPSE
jgi:cardiolipin synthase (CMP-forming)